jgi:hypothetical protein
VLHKKGFEGSFYAVLVCQVANQPQRGYGRLSPAGLLILDELLCRKDSAAPEKLDPLAVVYWEVGVGRLYRSRGLTRHVVARYLRPQPSRVSPLALVRPGAVTTRDRGNIILWGRYETSVSSSA